MSVFSGPEMVGSGLMVCFDAGSTRSYPGTGTIWYDVSGYGNNSTLTNGPVYSSGSISFDGIDDYANFYAPNLTTTATVEMWARIGSGYSGKMFFGWNTYDIYCPSGTIGYNTGASDLYGISAATVTSLGIVNTWAHYVFEMRSDISYTNNKMYINTSLMSLSQQLGTESAANRNFSSGLGRIAIWRSSAAAYLMPMNCAMFKVYNRALLQSEIQQNFEASRTRFGI